MKSIIVLVSLLSFLKVLVSDNIRIESNLPTELVSGQRHLIEIEIDKGDIQGFSKLELSLPTGFKAMPADIHGASFTFSGGRARFVWMEMPSSESFTVSYFLESEPAKEGYFEISGVFSFVNANIRKDIKIPARQIKLLAHREVALSEYSLKDELELVCERSVVRLNESEFEVKLKVKNNNIQGFGKILESLPAGCVPRKLNDGGAVVTLDGNSIKFVWFEVPDAQGFEVSYLVSCPTVCNTMDIKGQISYTENRKPYTIDIVEVLSATALETAQPKEALSTSADAEQTKDSSVTTAGEMTTERAQEVVTNPAEPVTQVEKMASESTEKAENGAARQEVILPASEKSVTGKIEPTATHTPKEQAPKEAEAISTEKGDSKWVSTPSKGVSYSVQILAAHRLVEKSYFEVRHGYGGGFNIENHEGWIKYTTGKYDDYKQARDARENVKTSSRNLPGPFVAAYQDGNRITVQEALLISNQTWYP